MLRSDQAEKLAKARQEHCERKYFPQNVATCEEDDLSYVIYKFDKSNEKNLDNGETHISPSCAESIKALDTTVDDETVKTVKSGVSSNGHMILTLLVFLL